MAFTPNAAQRLARATFIVLCKLMLVDVVCSFVADWLFYFALGRRKIELAASAGSGAASPSDTKPGLQVIVCGISRSGTTSLRQAMHILGLPCFHFGHLFNPTTAKLFTQAATSGASHDDWQHLLQGYKSIVGLPAASSYKELMELYPNAKVVLNVRDPQKWYDSFSRTILQMRKNLSIQVVQPRIERCVELFLIKRLLKGKAEDKETSIANYKLYIEEVKQNVPPHKLHIIYLEKNEGWDSLCKFLEVPIPNVPFPFINKTEQFRKDTLGGIRMTNKVVLVCYWVLMSFVALIGWKWGTKK